MKAITMSLELYLIRQLQLIKLLVTLMYIRSISLRLHTYFLKHMYLVEYLYSDGRIVIDSFPFWFHRFDQRFEYCNCTFLSA